MTRDNEHTQSTVAQEPVAWVRRHPDGALTAEFLEHAVIETVRKRSSAWVPLYAAPVAAQAQSITPEAEPIAVVGREFSLFWAGSGPIAPLVERHGIKVGSKLYAHPPSAQAQPKPTRPTVTMGMIARAWDVFRRAEGASFWRYIKDAIEAALDVAQKDGQFAAQQPVSGADGLPTIEVGGKPRPQQWFTRKEVAALLAERAQPQPSATPLIPRDEFPMLYDSLDAMDERAAEQPERIAVRRHLSSIRNGIGAVMQALANARARIEVMEAKAQPSDADGLPRLENDTRAALLYALWHHQGGSSPVGQPIRRILGIEQHAHLTKEQYAEAHRVQDSLGFRVEAQPQPSGNAGELSRDLLGRVSDALGRFVSDEGWKQEDTDLADEFAAALAAQASGQSSGNSGQLDSEKSDGWKMEMDDSDRYINELCQQYGYVHPLAIAARLEQWISRHGGEDAGTLAMGEAMRALRKANDLNQDVETLLTMLGNHEYAEHWAKTDIGKRLESAMTAMHGELSNARAATKEQS